ncbi:MAG: hypothetical protein DRG31_04730 [Deltaproteobacteria bacterium]|nr:MAG: hypothetical protein DRG31_04730 [Deltaproteobacteria bacterium]
MEEQKRCILCKKEGSLLYRNVEDRLFGIPGKWDILECPKCQLAWLFPRPSKEELLSFYPENYHTHQGKSAFQVDEFKKDRSKVAILQRYGYYKEMPLSIRDSLRVLLYGAFLQHRIGRKIRWLKAVPGGCLLDIGCGNGTFLYRMKELGWEVVGVDPDPDAVAIANKFGLNVILGTVEEAEFANASFAAITMNHVIEHVTDPMSLLKECHRIMRPAGQLVIVTPNVRSLGHIFFGRNWLDWDVPRHLFIFSTKSLKICVEQAGFKIRRVYTDAKRARRVWTASKTIKRTYLKNGKPHNLSLKDKMQALTFQLLESMLNKFFRIGEEIILVAEK